MKVDLKDDWLPSKDAPERETVIVRDAKNTGAGWHNGHGQWFVYGSSIPMETPTHYMPFPSVPNGQGHRPDDDNTEQH